MIWLERVRQKRMKTKRKENEVERGADFPGRQFFCGAGGEVSLTAGGEVSLTTGGEVSLTTGGHEHQYM
jgi:hypothetical protein